MIYKLINLIYDNLKTLMPLVLAIMSGIWYLLFNSVRNNIKDKNRTWDKDKYRNF